MVSNVYNDQPQTGARGPRKVVSFRGRWDRDRGMRPVTQPHASILAAGLSAGLCLLAPGRAAAQSKLPPSVTFNYGENETPRSAAMGGALRALATGSSALFLNPAALPEAR